MKKLNYYFIRDYTDFEFFKDLTHKKKVSLNSIAVLWDDSHTNFLNKNKVSYLILNNYSKKINFNIIRKKLFEFIKTFPHKKILDEKSFVELLEYEGFSLWWIIRQGFYSRCLQAMKEIHFIRLLAKREKIRELTVLNNDEEFVAIIKEAIKNLKIKINFPHKRHLSKNENYFKNKKELLLDNFPRIIRIMQGFFRSLQIQNHNKKINILIFTKSHVWSGLGANVRGDPYFHLILKELLKSPKCNLIALDTALTRKGAWTAIREKKKPFMPYDYFIFKSLFNGNMRKKLKILKIKLSNLWKELGQNENFGDIFLCEDTYLYPILKHSIKSYFFDDFGSLISAARNIEIAKRIIEDYDINSTLCIDENDAARFLVFASRIKGIPSLGLQHGVIAPLGSIAYNYGKNDLYRYKGNLNCHLTDNTAVYGNYFKKLLIKEGNYPADMIVVTGQPRMDIIFGNKNSYSKESLYKRLGINKNDKLVVYATDFIGEESKIAFSAIIHALKELKDVKLLIKLHPAEDKKIYTLLLKEFKYDAIVSKDVDLYEIIVCSDLVISILSTVILEALALGTPVIQLNLFEKYNMFGEEANKLIKRATNEKDLHDTIKKILNDKPLFGNINKKMKKFISEYYYKIDGKSSERIVEELEKLLKTKRQ